MTYFLFYHLFRIVAKLRFKSINLNTGEYLNIKLPLIIIANHGNSFLDAILLAVVFKRKLHFLARADVFNSKFKRWFLSKINMMPIYRIRDGREALKNNDLIFSQCDQILKSNGAILIFPEGNCVVEKRLRTFKTGFVNLAIESEVENLAVLPISINYNSLKTLNTDVHIVFNNLINVAALKQENSDFLSFSKELLAQSRQAIAQNMVQINDANDVAFYNQIFTLVRNNKSPFENISAQINTSTFLDHLKLKEPHIFNKLAVLSKNYFEELMLISVDDLAVNRQFAIVEKFICFTLLPFYFIGKLINVLPSYVVHQIVNTKVKDLQFKNSVKLVLSPIIYTIYICLLAFAPSILDSKQYTIFFLLLALILVYAYTKNILDLFLQYLFIKTQDLENLKKQRSVLENSLNL
jgi:1-acyl-sn-glycerol-3-phosphate acyltransferase